MTLVVNNDDVSEEAILSRYGDNIFSKYTKLKSETEKIVSDINSEKLAIKVDLNIRIVKDKDEAKTTFRIAKEGETPALIIKEFKDTNLTHRYRQKRVREMVTDNLRRKGINLKLSQYDLKLICDKYNLKSEEKYFYKHELTGNWGCSQQLIDFITELLIKNPNEIEDIKTELKSK